VYNIDNLRFCFRLKYGIYAYANICTNFLQAALPQSITSFIFAKEYGLHADVLSTAVIFGMLVSLPLLVGFYIVLELIR